MDKGAVPPPRARPSAPAAPQDGRGPGLLQSAGALPPPAAPDRAGHPDPQGPAASARLRQDRIPRAQSGRAADQPAQAASPHRHPLREASRQLPGYGHARHDHALAHMSLQRRSRIVARLSRSRCPLLYRVRSQPHWIVEGSADDVSRQLALVSLDLDLRAERGELRRQMS